MATIKSYSDPQQSKKLAEILPLESADMCYIQDLLAGCEYGDYKPYIGDLIPAYGQGKIRCWSLAALLSVLPAFTIDSSDDHYFRVHCYTYFSEWHNNPIDAYYEMVLKLKEKN